LVGEVIQKSSVITLTEDVDVDAHDCEAPTLRRMTTRWVAGLCQPESQQEVLDARQFGVDR
jgi:hypothetical protein